MKPSDTALDKKVEKALENVSKKLGESAQKSLKVIVSLMDPNAPSECYDRWLLTVKKSADAPEQDDNALKVMSDSLRNRMAAIAVEVAYL